MSDADPSTDDLLALNGIDGSTGRPAFEALSTARIAQIVRALLPRPTSGDEPDDEPQPSGAEPVRGVGDLAMEGWAVVVPKGLDPAIRAAIEPLCALRREQAGKRYAELDFDPEQDDFRVWLERHEVSPGSPDRNLVPKYLLLLGPPSLIPFELQHLLGIEYGVGRLALETVAEYAAYAASVVRYETAAAASTAREACFWGPRRDPATELSSDDLLAPLVKGWGRSCGVAEDAGFRATALLADEATKKSLVDALHRPAAQRPPTLVFTASHGAVWPSGHARQAAEQGALLANDWFPGEIVEPTHRVAADDVTDDARVHGLVAFFFACYGVATPAVDGYPRSRAEPPRIIAPGPLLSALPRRLLAHPRGGALGVFGHVDRAWGYSIRRAGAVPQIGPFHEGILRVLAGAPLGDALGSFSVRYAALSASLLGSLDRGVTPPSDRELAQRWIERNDAQGYVLLGDPGARVRGDVAP